MTTNAKTLTAVLATAFWLSLGAGAHANAPGVPNETSNTLEAIGGAAAHAAIAESEGLVFVDVFAEW